MKISKLFAFVTLVASSGFAGAASVGTLGTAFTPGTGNSNTNFVIDVTDTEPADIEVGIKAKERFQGDLPVTGTTYRAPPGSPDSDGLASWNIDFSWDLGTNTLTDYVLKLGLDFDPTAAENFVETSFTPTLSITQGSQNPGFGFWATLTSDPITAALASGFDPDAGGTYSFFASVEDTSGNELARAAGAVLVTPLPAAAWLFLSALAGMFGLNRFKGAKPDPETVAALG